MWLRCLGYDVPDAATGYEAQRLFEHAGENQVYQQPVNHNQAWLCAEFHITLQPGDRLLEAAGRIYEILLLRAWVYSVFRHWTGDSASRYTQLPLDPKAATRIAHELSAAGFLESIREYATTDGRSTDVFYRMSLSAVNDRAYAFVVERLPAPLPSVPISRPERTGCLGIAAVVVISAIGLILFC